MGLFSGALRSIYDKVADRRVVPASPPHRIPNAVHDVAPPDALARPASCSSFAMFIHYEDNGGEHSWRRIVCRRVEIGSYPLVHAYCLERKAARTFRADRILEAVALETGEILDVSALIADLKERGLPVDDARLGRILTTLTFLMRCDREEHPLEHKAVEEAITSYAIRFDGNDALVAQGLSLAGSLAPDGGDFTRSLRWLTRAAEAPQLARFVLRHAADVIDADGRHTPEEIQFGCEVSEFLKKIAAS